MNVVKALPFPYFELPPEIQLFILEKTQMNPLEIRRLKLVSQRMRSLIENMGQQLTRQTFIMMNILEKSPGCYVIRRVTMKHTMKHTMSIDNIPRVLGSCRFRVLSLYGLKLTVELCDHLYNLIKKGKVVTDSLDLQNCEFVPEMPVNAFDRLLSQSCAFKLISTGYQTKGRIPKEFFSLPSALKQKCVMLANVCDFFDDDFLKRRFRTLELHQCCVTERGLRRVIEDLVACKYDFQVHTLNLRRAVDVDRLLKGLPKVKKEKNRWRVWTNWGDSLFIRLIDNSTIRYYLSNSL